MISLVSSSGERFPSGTYPCMHCKTLANFIEEDESVDCIPLPNVTSPLLDQMLKFFDDRLEAARQITCSPTLENEDMLSEAHVSFLWAHSIRYLECNSNERIIDLLLTADYLSCDLLVDLLATIIASRISGKSRDEMRAILGIENDFTEEEEEQILAEHAWCFVR